MESIIFTCNDVSITVNSDHSEIINYLNNMFGNYYNDISKDIDYEINFFIGMPTSTTYIDHEKGDPTENYIDGSTEELNIYIPYFDKTKESFVKRIFTTTTVKVFEKKGYTILHGACAIKDNKGVIITGEAGSGKTTLLTKLLKNGYGYIANDRLAIKRDNDNIVVCGIPYSMGINEKDIAKSFNEFDSYSINEINKKFLENKEVPKYFCTYMKSHIELGTIVFCKYDRNKTGISITDINLINDLIATNIMYDDAIPEQKGYLHNIIGRYNNKCDLSDVNSFELLQGKSTEKEVVEQVDENVVRRRFL